MYCILVLNSDPEAVSDYVLIMSTLTIMRICAVGKFCLKGDNYTNGLNLCVII